MKKELKAFLTYTILLFGVGNSNIFGSVSNTVTSSLKFATQPKVVAVDEFGNIDLDYSTDITLSLATGSGTLNGTKTITPIDGNASFSDLNYSATVDKETFSLKANSGGLTEATSEDIIADVVATQLSFDTQPSPTTISSGEDTQFTSSPVIQAVDSDGVVDTDYSEDITLSVTDPTDGTVDGTVNSLTLSSGDQDSDGTTVTLSSSSGEATFSDLSINYTNAGSVNSGSD